MRILILILLTGLFTITNAQTVFSTDTIGAQAVNENVIVKKVDGDSLASVFVIIIAKEVKLHKHALHSESVTILEGEAEMQLGNKQIKIKKGDVIFIPKNIPHAVKVTSSIPLKLVSVQAPYFDGSDRIFIEK